MTFPAMSCPWCREGEHDQDRFTMNGTGVHVFHHPDFHCWLCWGKKRWDYAGSQHIGILANINGKTGHDMPAHVAWDDIRRELAYPMTYTDLNATPPEELQAVRDAIENFVLHHPGLEDAKDVDPIKSVIEVGGTVLRAALLQEAQDNQSGVIIYRGIPLVTEEAARRIFTTILQQSGQLPEQIRVRHYQPNNAAAGKPNLSAAGIQASGYGGVWDWAHESPGSGRDTPAPEQPHLIHLPRLDPAPSPQQGAWGALVLTTVYAVAAMVKAKGYKDAAPDEAVQALAQNTPAHVQANPITRNNRGTP